MKLKISIIFVTFCAFWWIGESTQSPLSCVRKHFLREKRVKHLVLIDQNSDLRLAPLFDTTDWSITIPLSKTPDEGQPQSDVIITTSSKHFNVFGRLEQFISAKRRIHVILNDEQPSIDTVRSIFLKFRENVRSNVNVIAEIAANLWQFYRLTEPNCSKSVEVEAFAGCHGSESDGNLTYSLNHTTSRGKKCPLIVAATKFEPFTYYDESRGFHQGIDYVLVKNIAAKLQIDVNFVGADVNTVECVFGKFIVKLNIETN